MDRQEKMKLLARAAQYDLCAPCGAQTARVRDDIGHWLFPAQISGGKTIALLKVLQSNSCENDCFYCGTRRSRNGLRLTFTPEELAWSFDQLVRSRRVEGLFLSSAVCHDVGRSMESMIATVELVRFKYRFQGYVHLKLLPGCEESLAERAVQIADRVSVNLEAPNPERLERLSGDKRFAQDLMQPMAYAKRFRDLGLGAKAGLTTQFVVGAAGETDAEILQAVDRLYHQVDLTRAYFSAFRPVSNTPLENLPATPALRQHRLYQSDFLLRYYGFTFRDLQFDTAGNLPVGADPKMAWARTHPEFFPVEVNRASKEQLLRVPGIGPQSARRILQRRREGKLHRIEALRALGVVAQRAAPFILLNGRRPPQQLSLC
jgi:predicted DNA-binding helix-hairpin-helix protein